MRQLKVVKRVSLHEMGYQIAEFKKADYDLMLPREIVYEIKKHANDSNIHYLNGKPVAEIHKPERFFQIMSSERSLKNQREMLETSFMSAEKAEEIIKKIKWAHITDLLEDLRLAQLKKDTKKVRQKKEQLLNTYDSLIRGVMTNTFSKHGLQKDYYEPPLKQELSMKLWELLDKIKWSLGETKESRSHHIRKFLQTSLERYANEVAVKYKGKMESEYKQRDFSRIIWAATTLNVDVRKLSNDQIIKVADFLNSKKIYCNMEKERHWVPEKIYRLLKEAPDIVSSDAPLDDHSKTTFGEMIVDRKPNPEAFAIKKTILRKRINTFIERLKKRKVSEISINIYLLNIGLAKDAPWEHTRIEIAGMFGITKSAVGYHVRKIANMALELEMPEFFDVAQKANGCPMKEK